MLQVLANGFCLSAVYVILALGFALIYFTTKTFHLAHGVVYTLGAYVGYLAVVFLHLPLYLAGILVAVTAAAAGFLMEALVYRPLVRRRGAPEVVIIASLGTYIFGANLIALIASNDAKVLRSQMESTYTILGARLNEIQLAEVGIAALLVLTLHQVLSRTLAGKYWRAVADNQTLSTVLGFNSNRIRMTVFLAGSAFAGLAGYLRALDVGVNPYVGMQAVITAAVICILGGLGVFLAPVVGAIVLGLVQAIVTWYGSANWENAVTFSLLLVLLVLRPEGIFGVRRRLEEL